MHGPIENQDPPIAQGSQVPWHAQSSDAVIEGLQTRVSGLTSEEARERLARFGPNSLNAAAKRRWPLRVLAQFNDVLIYVLLVAAVIMVVMAHVLDAVVILLVVVANAIIGLIQEGRAENALASLQRMVIALATVVRDGQRQSVNAVDLVPGDVVILDAGDRVPADLRLVQCRALRIEEAILTGESLAVEKTTSASAASASLGDRTGIAFSGTLVVAGQATGVVVATGAASEIGRIGTMLSEVSVLKTPLIRKMDRFARQLTIITLIVGALVFFVAVFLRGYATVDAFLIVVSLAVSAIPEGLPAVMTITLAVGVQRMAARNAIIRRLTAVDTLGAVSIICSDKTGTLTRNEMTVQSVVTAVGSYEVTGVGYEPKGDISGDPRQDAAFDLLVQAAILCNDAHVSRSDSGWTVAGDPMEGALVVLAMKAGLDPATVRERMTRIDAIPFDAQHRFMATLNLGETQRVILVKGAPERMLEMSGSQQRGAAVEPLQRESWVAQIDRLGNEGQRVLGVAMRRVALERSTIDFAAVEGELTMLGLVGIIDPPREEARHAIADCRTAGIRVKMITGDHGATAAAIGAQLNLAQTIRSTTGARLEQVSDAELPSVAEETSVFARTTPEHKLRLVAALQSRGDVVSMTGDGVNDAPALKRADVGVAMGINGTEAAKEAAQMVLADDNFASIVAAVREGRTVYDNLQKVIGWTLPTNGGEALAVIAAIAFGATLPLSPLQILWINLATSIALGMTLAFEPAEPNIMQRPPRQQNAGLLSGLLVWRICFVSVLFVVAAFGLFDYVVQRGGSVEEARTVVTNGIVALEVAYLFNVRYAHMTSINVRGFLGTRPVLIGLAAMLALQLVFTYAPFMHTFFQTRSLSLRELVVIAGVAVGAFLLVEIEKQMRHRWLGE